MFAKTKNGYGLIGERKEDVLYSLDTGLYTLEVTKSFFGKSMKFVPVDRYKTAKTMNPVDKPAKRSKSTATSKSKVVA